MADMQGRLPDRYSASCRCELDDARTGSLVQTPYILCANTGMDRFCIAVAVNFACNTSKQDRRAFLWGKSRLHGLVFLCTSQLLHRETSLLLCNRLFLYAYTCISHSLLLVIKLIGAYLPPQD